MSGFEVIKEGGGSQVPPPLPGRRKRKKPGLNRVKTC